MMSGHEHQRHSQDLPSFDEQRRFIHLGLTLDHIGRPLHPWIDSDDGHARIADTEGKGEFWSYGPNMTADSVIINEGLDGIKIALIKRSDNGLWALPGGFIDPEETAYEAAIREASEEANIDLNGLQFEKIYDGPVADYRSTRNAWPHTTAHLFTLADLSPLRAADDAADARWITYDELPSDMHGSHRQLIVHALTVYRT